MGQRRGGVVEEQPRPLSSVLRDKDDCRFVFSFFQKRESPPYRSLHDARASSGTLGSALGSLAYRSPLSRFLGVVRVTVAN